jgi:hypothetical protein
VSLRVAKLESAAELAGVIRLGDPSSSNFGPLYRGQRLVHGMGFSRSKIGKRAARNCAQTDIGSD